jgi:nicotinate (nicotinamide) nucleotide adenylyltransferase
VLGRGGSGGRGNRQFATPTRQTPRFAEIGTPGEEADFDLRLKLLADAALVGLPNAGKSSLLTRISNAKPKVAGLPLHDSRAGARHGRRSGRAAAHRRDVPGLIEGASEGVGLGHEFLAHLERARLLVHVIDAAAGDPAEQFRTIDRELAEYGAGLETRPQVVVLNKIDLLPEPSPFEVDDERIQRVFLVSCATGAGIEEFRRALFELVPEPEELPSEADGLADFLVYRPVPRARPFKILRTDRGFRVTGRVPQGEELEEALRAAGAKTGDEVQVGDDGPRIPVIGILGGTFDPPHNGHIALAEAALVELDLDELVVLLVANPGHRPCVEDAETRLALAEAAFARVPRARVERDENPYTVDAVRGGRFGDAVFVVGADEGAAFPLWREPDEILRWVRLAVGTRSGYPPPDLERYGDRVISFELASPPISSNAVRARIRKGKPVDDLVPSGVALLIEERGLYRNPG